MRPASSVEPAAASSAPPPRISAKCDVHTCPWWPYTNSKDFKINTALIIIILFCALLCALAFNAAIRYILRRRNHHGRREQDVDVDVDVDVEVAAAQQQKEAAADDIEVVVHTMMFSAEMKLNLAGTEAECIICLSEFVKGDKIRVLDKCKHGFHVHCIQKWFVSHSSCPTCRATCFTAPTLTQL